MRAKQYLGQLKNIKNDIGRIRMQILDIDMKLKSPGALRYDKDPVQTSPSNQMEEQIVRLVEMKDRLLQKENAYREKFMLINEQLDSLENPLHREILKQFFLEQKKIWKIAIDMDYSQQHIYNHFSIALSEFEDKYLRE